MATSRIASVRRSPVMNLRGLVSVAFFVFVVGCSKRDEPTKADASAPAPAVSGKVASCDRVTSAGVCSEWSGSYLAQNSALVSASCQRLSGTFVMAECPNTTVLGSCTLSTTEVRRFYSAGGFYDAAKAQKECETSLKGKFGGP